MAELRTIETTSTLYYPRSDGNMLSLYIAKTTFTNGEEFYLKITKPIAKGLEEGTVYIYNGNAPASVAEGVYKIYAGETEPFGILEVKEGATYKCTFLDVAPPSTEGHRVIMKLSISPPTEEIPEYKCCRCFRRRCYRCCCKNKTLKPNRPPFNPN